jgi:hypothetical protein
MKSLRFLASTATLAAISFIILSPSARADEFVVNGSFEADPFTGSGLGYKLGLVGSDVTGWFIPASDGTYPWGLQNTNAFGAGPAADGNQWLVLGETGASGGTPKDYTIQQTMTGLTPGSTYNLSFDISSEEQISTGSGSVVEVSFLGGSSTAAADFTAPAAVSFWNPWSLETESFVATSSSVTLQFKDLAIEFPGGADLGLDNVHVSTASSVTPEPSSIVLLASGLFGIGLFAAFRKIA